MFGENEVIVVDYKFGKTKSPTHINQVREYIDLLTSMGYENIKGFIWYVESGEWRIENGEWRMKS
jgi:CRISPR/Cas system-associated exonuclease Cas4 (RecB family)